MRFSHSKLKLSYGKWRITVFVHELGHKVPQLWSAVKGDN